MKFPPIAVVLTIALTVAGAAYSLDRGVYVGSDLVLQKSYWHLICKYMFPSGVRERDTGGWGTAEEAKRQRNCTLFYH